MSSSPGHRSRWLGWAGLVAPPAAWAMHHQVGGDLNFWDCGRGDGRLLVALGLVLLLMALAGGGLSFLAWRADTQAPGKELYPSARFIAALGLMSSGLFSLTIVLQITAAVVLPPCFR